MAWVVLPVPKPVWEIVDGQVYLSISHWGMFPVGPRVDKNYWEKPTMSQKET